MKPSQQIVKRLFDITGAAAGLLFLFPFACIVIALLKISSGGGPVFFLQQRVGRFGQLFTCIKFRTMIAGAEQMGTVTTSSDVRITSVGRFLRKFKLDEFPQLWNVLIGRMSFVGPRPDVVGYADKLVGEDRKILDLRPGITGPATLFFRYEEELLAGVAHPQEYNDTVIWPTKIRINMQYSENWSFWTDIAYIMVTVFPFLNSALRVYPQSPSSPEQLEVYLHPLHGDVQTAQGK